MRLSVAFVTLVFKRKDSWSDLQILTFSYFFSLQVQIVYSANPLSTTSIGCESGPCVGAASSERSYSNLLQKWRNKWSALELLINLEQLLTWVHTHTHTAKRAAVVSQNVRQEPPEASDVMSGAVGSNRYVSEELVWKLIQHESPCRCSEEANDSRVPQPFHS